MLRPLPLEKVYQLIEPGPVVLLLTAAKSGRPNVMTMSWHMMVEFTPPQIACVVSAGNHSFSALRETRECVVAVPHVGQAALVVAIGNCSGRASDKLEAHGIATSTAKHVKPPLMPECIANLECRVIETRLVNRFNLFVLEVVAAWINPALRNAKTIHHCGYGAFIVDGERIELPSAKP